MGVECPILVWCPYACQRLPASRSSRIVPFLCIAALSMAACSSSPGNAKVPAGAKSSGGMHGSSNRQGSDRDRVLCDGCAEGRRELPVARRAWLLRRLDVPPHREGVHDPGGDPAGDGTGGESAWGAPVRRRDQRGLGTLPGGYRRGLVAMANAGPNTNGSQFFILHQDYPLPPRYVIFARVTQAWTSSMPWPTRRRPWEPMAG